MNATGTWNLSVHTPIGEQKPVLVLSEDGGKLVGTLAMPGSEAQPITDGAAAGAALSFNAAVKVPFPVSLAFALQISGDSLSGTCKPHLMPASEVTGTRAA